jgi:hypothetical protein
VNRLQNTPPHNVSVAAPRRHTLSALLRNTATTSMHARSTLAGTFR